MTEHLHQMQPNIWSKMSPTNHRDIAMIQQGVATAEIRKKIAEKYWSACEQQARRTARRSGITSDEDVEECARQVLARIIHGGNKY